MDNDLRCVNLHALPSGEPRLFAGFRRNFMSIDIDGGISTDIPIDESITKTAGAPVATVNLDKGNILLCFEDYGYPVKPNGDPAGRPLKWRTKITGAC